MRILNLFILVALFIVPTLVYAEEPADVKQKIAVVGPLSAEIVSAFKLSGDRDVFMPPDDLMKRNNPAYLANAIQKEAPQWAVVDQAFADKRLLKILQKNTPVLIIEEKLSVEDLAKTIKEAGAFLASEKQAAKLSRSLVKLNKDLQLKLNTVPAEIDMMYVAGVDKNNNPVASGYDTAAEKIMLMAGGFNVVDLFPGYRPLTVEAAAGLKPKKLLVAQAALDQVGGTDAFAALPAIATMAVDRTDIMPVVAEDFDTFGPSTMKVAFRLARDLFPEVDFSDVAVN